MPLKARVGYAIRIPQKTFDDCAKEAGVEGISQEVADLIQNISDLEGISRELLAVTLMNESSLSSSSLHSDPNTNGHPEDIMKWDVGPFQINIYWTLAAVKKGEVSFDGLIMENVFGYNFYHSDMKTPATFSGDPLSNGRMAARRLNAIGGSDENKAVKYAPPYARAHRKQSFKDYAPRFQQFFNCYPR
jgi:hypothetical protein